MNNLLSGLMMLSAGNGELQEELVQFLKPEGESSTASRASSATVAM
jgi:hypothetical protein